MSVTSSEEDEKEFVHVQLSTRVLNCPRTFPQPTERDHVRLKSMRKMYIRGESANMKRESERNEEKVLSGGSHAIL